MATLNIPLTGVSGTTEQQVSQLKQQVYNLTEQLRYAMENIEPHNFSGAYRQQVERLENLAEGLSDAVYEGGKVDPEILRDRFERLRDEIVANAKDITQVFNSAIEQTRKSITFAVSEEYAAKTELAALDEYMRAEFNVTSTSIDSKFTNEKTVLLETAEGYVTKLQNTIETMIRFDGNGIKIGKSDSKFTAVFTNEKLSFMQGTVEVACFSNNMLYVTGAQMQKLTIGALGGYVDIYIEADGLVGAWRT